MIEISELTRLGFGAYRVSSTNSEHRRALTSAIASGCNLIDTASTYEKGLSEKLIGDIVSSNQEIFIITKAGYIPKEELADYENLAGFTSVDINKNSHHSISPVFLQQRLKQSLTRLRVNCIDCFLLHNIEYQLKGYNDAFVEEKFYQNILDSFRFLEEQVAKGVIRFYGVSSNTIHQRGSSCGIKLDKLLTAASTVVKGHHFKFVQFPFNIFENDAELRIGTRPSLLEFTRNSGVRSIGNRPFNADLNKQAFRLAQQNVNERLLPETEHHFSTIIEMIDRQLENQGSTNTASGIPIIQTIKLNLDKISDRNTVENLVNNKLKPVVSALFENLVSASTDKLINEFAVCFENQAKHNMNEILQKLRPQLLSGRDSDDDKESFQSLLISKYLRSGIDHVIAGLRSESYVSEMKKFFYA